jgi:hypothetical protein
MLDFIKRKAQELNMRKIAAIVVLIAAVALVRVRIRRKKGVRARWCGFRPRLIAD